MTAGCPGPTLVASQVEGLAVAGPIDQTVPSLVRIPVNGGSYTPLVNFPANTVNTINPGALGWKW